MKLKFLLPFIAFIAVALLLGLGLTMNPEAIPSTKIDKPAPEFTLPLLSDAEKSFSPADLKGQRWVLNVWASWCVSCRTEHPILNQLAAGGANIVGLNYKDDNAKATQWLLERGNPYTKSPVDANGLAGIEWGVIAVPETFVIDENGLVVFKHTGPITSAIANTEIRPRLVTGTAQAQK